MFARYKMKQFVLSLLKQWVVSGEWNDNYRVYDKLSALEKVDIII